MSRKKMSAHEFAAACPRLAHLSVRSVELARKVLVEGQRQVDVADEAGISKQSLSGIIRRVRQAIDSVPDGWVKVEVWLPAEKAKEVEDMADKERRKLL